MSTLTAFNTTKERVSAAPKGLGNGKTQLPNFLRGWGCGKAGDSDYPDIAHIPNSARFDVTDAVAHPGKTP